MNTQDIENAANAGGLATPDFPLRHVLRFNVIPGFLIDVGDVYWIKKYATIPVVAGTQDYALPSDFLRIRKIGAPKNYPTKLTGGEMQYVGENDDLIMELEQNTDQGAPTKYRIIANSDGEFKAIRFYLDPDAAYTIPYTYTSYVPFKNPEEDKDLASFCPDPLHWAFVEGLKREILVDRFGEGDPRYARTNQEYGLWISRANRLDMREPGPRGAHRVYAR